MDDWEATLRREFGAEEGTFLLRLRCELTWDRAAFDRMTQAMRACGEALAGAPALPRWVAEGFWFVGHFVRDWSSHASFSREHEPAYYESAYGRLNDLAHLLFTGDSPYQD